MPSEGRPGQEKHTLGNQQQNDNETNTTELFSTLQSQKIRKIMSKHIIKTIQTGKERFECPVTYNV